MGPGPGSRPAATTPASGRSTITPRTARGPGARWRPAATAARRGRTASAGPHEPPPPGRYPGGDDEEANVGSESARVGQAGAGDLPDRAESQRQPLRP